VIKLTDILSRTISKLSQITVQILDSQHCRCQKTKSIDLYVLLSI